MAEAPVPPSASVPPPAPATLPAPTPAQPRQRTLDRVDIYIGPAKGVQVGDGNTFIFVTSKDVAVDGDGILEQPASPDMDNVNSRHNNRPVTDAIICSDKQQLNYKIKGGETTFISVGDFCNIVEIVLSDELYHTIRHNRNAKLISGTELVSILWSNDNGDEVNSQLKVEFLTQDGHTDTLESEIFHRLQGDNFKQLRILIAELLNIYKSKLKHIQIGCIQLIISNDSREAADNLQQQQEGLKLLLHRTIIPESISITCTIQQTGQNQPTRSLFGTVQDIIVPEETNRTSRSMMDVVVKHMPSIEDESGHTRVKQSVKGRKRYLSSEPPIKPTKPPKPTFKSQTIVEENEQIKVKEFNPYEFSVPPSQTTTSARHLLRGFSVPTKSKRFPPTIAPQLSVPIGFEHIASSSSSSSSSKNRSLWLCKDKAKTFLEEHPTSNFSYGELYQKAFGILTSRMAVLIYGNRGSGKSWLVSNLVRDLISDVKYQSYEPVSVSSHAELLLVVESPTPIVVIVDDMDRGDSIRMMLDWGRLYESISSSNDHIKLIFVTGTRPPVALSMYSLFQNDIKVILNNHNFATLMAVNLYRLCQDEKSIDLAIELGPSIFESFIDETVVDGSIGAAIMIKIHSKCPHLFNDKDLLRKPCEFIRIQIEHNTKDLERFLPIVLLALMDEIIDSSGEVDTEIQHMIDLLNTLYSTNLSYQDILDILSKDTKESFLVEYKEDTNTYRFTNEILTDAVLEHFAVLNMDFLIEHGSNNILHRLTPEFSSTRKHLETTVRQDQYPKLVTRFIREIENNIDEINTNFLLDRIFLQTILNQYSKEMLLKLINNGQYVFHFIILYGTIEACVILGNHLTLKQIHLLDEQVGYSVMHYSAETPFDSTEKVALFASKFGPEISLMNKDSYGNTPVHLASFWNKVETVRTFISLFEDENRLCESVNNDDETPLLICVKRGHLATLKVLIDNKVDVNGGTVSEKPINIAARQGDLPILQLLLTAGADVYDITEDTKSLLAEENRQPILKTLQDAGLNISTLAPLSSLSASRSALSPGLHLAIRRHAKEDELRGILQGMDDKEICDENGDTALHLSVQYCNLPAVQLLLENGVNHNSLNKNRDGPLHMACLTHRTDIVATLLHVGADINCRNVDGNLPLHLAVRYSVIETIQLIITSGSVYKDGQNKDGDTPLHIASRYGKLQAIELLAGIGAYVEVINEQGETPLLVAVNNNRVEVVAMLLDNGANVNTRDVNGYTPLHRAAKRSNVHVAEILLNHADIDIHILDKKRYTAAHYADSEIKSLLVERGCRTTRKIQCSMM